MRKAALLPVALALLIAALYAYRDDEPAPAPPPVVTPDVPVQEETADEADARPPWETESTAELAEPEIEDPAVPTGTVTVVVHALGGGALSGVTLVRESERETAATTGDDGTATIRVPELGARVHASLPGYVPVNAYVGMAQTRIELAPGAAVTGTVRHDRDGSPVAGARVAVWSDDGLRRSHGDAQIGRTRTTGPDGSFVFYVPPKRAFTLQAVMDGFGAISANTVAAPAGTQLDLVLGRGGIVEGQVTHRDGGPARDVEVRLVSPEAPRPGEWSELGTDWTGLFDFGATRALTDVAGRYRIRGVPAGVWIPMALGPEGQAPEAELVRFGAGGGTVKRDFVLPPPSRVTVVVAPGSGLSSGMGVTAWGRGLIEDAEASIGEGGKAVLTGLGEGEYWLWIGTGPSMHGSERRHEFTLRVEAGVDQEVRFDGEAAAVKGRVVDAAGNPVRRLEVEFDAGDGQWGTHGSTYTGTDGAFEVRGQRTMPGTLTVQSGMWEIRGPGGAVFSPVEVAGVTPGGEPVLVVVRESATVTGRFHPVPERRVSLWHDGWDVLTTKADGSFEQGELRTGTPLTLTFILHGHRRIVFEHVTLQPGERHDVGTLDFETGEMVSGRVTDARGEPLSRAFVEALSQHVNTMTDDDGDFTLRGLTDEPVRLRIGVVGPLAARELVVDPTSPEKLDVRLTPGGLVFGRVRGADGAPRGNVEIAFRGEDGALRAPATTRADGRFSKRLEPGRYRVGRAPKAGAVFTPSTDAVVGEGGAHEANLQIE